MIVEFDNIVDNWYITTKNTYQFNTTDLKQLDAFKSTAKKTTGFWYNYLNQNQLQQTNLTVASKRFRLIHWIGIAIMDAGGAFIGTSLGGPVGGVALGAAMSTMAHVTQL
jgi:hypothetical protein